MKVRFAIVFLGCFVGAVCVSGRASADEPSADDIEKARPHYERGVKFFETGDYDAARAELERAYAIAPTYRILFNLGQIQLKKSDYVGALKNFELYLAEAGSSIPDVRRAQVKADIEKLKTQVAQVTVELNVSEADVAVDDVVIGKSPLPRAILVNPGRRKLSATHPGKLPAAKVIEVVGRDSVTVRLEMQDSVRLIALDKPTRRVPWIGWAVTGALAVTAGVTGYVALNASNSLKDARDQPKANADRLDTYSSRTTTFGIIADVATVGALVAGGISLYYTLKWGSSYNRELDQWEHRTAEPPKAAVRWSPTGIAGTF